MNGYSVWVDLAVLGIPVAAIGAFLAINWLLDRAEGEE